MRFAFHAACSATYFFIFLAAANSKEVVLFNPGGSPVSDYIERLNTLAADDIVVFSDGTRLKVGKKLGGGNLTAVFDLADDPESVLRLPSNSVSSMRYSLESALKGISSFANGERALAEFGVEHVSAQAGLDREYLIVQKIPEGHTSLNAFLSLPASQVSSVQRTALIDFFRSVSGFSRIGDFHGEQLRYIPQWEKWVLIDWNSGHGSAYDLDVKSGELIAVSGQVGDPIFKPAIPVVREPWVAALQAEVESETVKVRRAMIAKGSQAVERYFDLRTMVALGPKFSYRTTPIPAYVHDNFVSCVLSFSKLSSLR